MDADIESGLVDKMIKKSIRFYKGPSKTYASSVALKSWIRSWLFIIVGFHKIAVKEAVKLGIPIVALVDTNHDPSDIGYIIPANDDSSSSIKFFTEIISLKSLNPKKSKLKKS